MKFKNVAAEAGVDAAAWGYGVCAGDYDGDGKLDLYVTNYGPNFLFRNKGDGTFEEVAAKAGVAAGGWSTGCAFLDADGDGDLDLYVARYVTAPWEEVAAPGRFLMWRGVAKVMLGPAGLPGAADLFFENQGDGTFKEATEKFGLTDTTKAYGFGVVATDYDGDGWTGHLRGQRLQPQLPLPQPRRPRLRERGADGRRGAERRGPGPGRHGRRLRRLRRRRPARHRGHHLRLRPQQPVPEPRRRHVRGRVAAGRARRRHLRRP